MRKSYSTSQIPALKRGIQLLRKAIKFHQYEPLLTLKLNELQDRIAVGLKFGSFNDLSADAKKHETPIFMDCFCAESNSEWRNIRDSIKRTLLGEIDSSAKGEILKYIEMISWYPAVDESIDRLKETSEEIINYADNYEIPNLFLVSNVDEKNRSITIRLNNPDLRYAYGTLVHLESSYLSLSDLMFTRKDIVVYHVQSINKGHEFKIEFNDHAHNRQFLPQVAVVDVQDMNIERTHAVGIIKGEKSYHYTPLTHVLKYDPDEFLSTQHELGLCKVAEEESIFLSQFPDGISRKLYNERA